MNKYIEEYKKCYNGSNFNKPINKSLTNYINTLSTNPTDINKTKNIFTKRKSKLINNPINLKLNLNINSNLFKSSRNDISETAKLKTSSKKINTFRTRPFSTNTIKDKIYIRNANHKSTLQENSPTSKFSSFSPNLKTQTQKTVKFKEEIKNFGLYNETTVSSSNFSNAHNNLSNRTLVNYKKNVASLSQGKKDRSRIVKKMGLEKHILFGDKMPSFNVKDYKKNLYFKSGFFVNEIIKLGLGPNIPLRKEIMVLNNDDSTIDNNIYNIESDYSHSRAFSLENNARKRRNFFLKITEV
jgi:hypothetical protein